METDLKAQLQKVSAFFKLLLCGIGSCMQWNTMERNTAVIGDLSFYL
jgi:hypothetical protein